MYATLRRFKSDLIVFLNCYLLIVGWLRRIIYLLPGGEGDHYGTGRLLVTVNAGVPFIIGLLILPLQLTGELYGYGFGITGYIENDGFFVGPFAMELTEGKVGVRGVFLKFLLVDGVGVGFAQIQTVENGGYGFTAYEISFGIAGEGLTAGQVGAVIVNEGVNHTHGVAFPAESGGNIFAYQCIGVGGGETRPALLVENIDHDGVGGEYECLTIMASSVGVGFGLVAA